MARTRHAFACLLLASGALLTAPGGASAQTRPASPAAAKPLTADDVILLVQSGLPEDVIIARIHRESHPADLSAQEMVRLKKAGASDNIIRALVGSAPGQTQPAAPAAPAPAAVQAVTQQQAEATIAEAMNLIKRDNAFVSRDARAVVRGVNQTGPTSATADLVFQNAVSDCGSRMGPANAGAPWLKHAWGAGQAEFKLYTGRGWTLTSINSGEIGCTGIFTMSIPVRQSYSAPGDAGSGAGSGPAGTPPAASVPPAQLAGSWSGRIGDAKGSYPISFKLDGSDGAFQGSGEIVAAGKTFPAQVRLNARGTEVTGTIEYTYKALLAKCTATMSISGQAESNATVTGAYTSRSNCSRAVESGRMAIEKK